MPQASMITRRSGQGSCAARLRNGRAAPLLLCYPAEMSRSELVIQLVKVALGLALGAYFVWWSLQVLSRLPPQ